jgi:hypothetical protein
MLLRGIGQSAREAWEVPRDLLLGRYPAFVTGGGLARGEVPVLVFHDAEPESFARKLEHLARNRYATLSIDEYLGVLRGSAKAPQRAVLLTFDDGRASVSSVAAPLLRRHGMRAVVFLVPGRVPAHAPRPASEHAALMSWEEIDTLARGGLFEFQSHTLLHARVHTGPALAGFVTPRSQHGYDAFDQPLVRHGERDLVGAEVPLGTPLLQSSPRTSEELRFFEHEAVRAACVAAVADRGGDAFFKRPDWYKQLRAVFGRERVEGSIESSSEQSAAIRRELVDARRIIEERVGRPVTSATPGTAGLQRGGWRQAGYEPRSAAVDGVPVTLPGGDPRAIARLSEDYLELLPGEGRDSLAAVLRRKWSRRFGSTPGVR